MTFRQVLDVLWQRKWLIVATVVLVVLFAFLYLGRQTPTYSSTATLRLSPAATATTDGSGGYTGVELDTDPEQITSPEVLTLSAPKAGEPNPGALAGSVSYATIEGVRTTKVKITATGASPEQAQRRANGVAAGYTAFLQKQVDDGLARLQKQKSAATKAITGLQRNVSANPKDQLASTNLSTALSQLVELNGQVNSIQNAGAPITVLQQAGPGAPTGTPASTVLLVAFVAGLLAGIGIALIRDQFDDRIRAEREVEELTGAPNLGEIALARGRKKDDRSLPIATRALTPFTESIRALRTSIQVLVPTNNAAVLLSSPEPGDGKSFVIANLAVSWARTGRSVILVGGDLRRPRLDWYFGEAADGAGFAELVRDTAVSGKSPHPERVVSLIRETAYPGLRILPPGSEPLNPADLLATESVSSIIAILRDLADVVLIDSPPALALADAAILSAHTDGVVVLATLGRTDREALSETVDVLRAKGATILGIVGNRSRRTMPKSYESYYLTAETDADVAENVDVDDVDRPDAKRTDVKAPQPAPSLEPQEDDERRLVAAPDRQPPGDRKVGRRRDT